MKILTMEDNDVEQYELYEYTYDDFITEEELKDIHPELDHNFPSPTMNSGVVSIHQNDPENIIDDPEDFQQYRS